jgi:hypothetical protein
MLQSHNVPSSVTIPVGATSTTFTVTTTSVTTFSPVIINASFGGITRTAMLTVTPSVAVDAVAMQIAEYASGSRELRVEATGSNSSAVLKCYVTATNALIRHFAEQRRRPVQWALRVAEESAEHHCQKQRGLVCIQGRDCEVNMFRGRTTPATQV